jgi:hypothetical protein
VPSLSGLDRFVRPTRHFRAGLLIVPSLRDCVAAVTVSRVSRFVACHGSSRVAVRRVLRFVACCGQSRILVGRTLRSVAQRCFVHL